MFCVAASLGLALLATLLSLLWTKRNDDRATTGMLSVFFLGVCVFLAWAADPEADERKLMGFKVMTALTVLSGFMWWYKRKVWSTVKHRRLELY